MGKQLQPLSWPKHTLDQSQIQRWLIPFQSKGAFLAGPKCHFHG
jgi:hypothetical protein